MQTVFIDSYFIVNLIVNYIMLIVTAKICAAPARRPPARPTLWLVSSPLPLF
jgi:hypothetical protein